MMKFNFSDREKSLFALTFLAIVIFVFYAGIYLPMHHQSVMLKEQIKAAERQLQKTVNTINKGKLSEQEYQTILEHFKQTASNEQEMSSILSQIQYAAQGMDMRISDRKPQKPKTSDLYNQFLVNLEIDGELMSITEFIHKLQNPPYLFHVDELRISQTSPQISELKCQVILSKILIR